MVEAANQYAMDISAPQQAPRTRPTYDFDAAVKRRFDSQNTLADPANQYSKQLADRRVAESLKASQDRVTKLQQESTITPASYTPTGGTVKGSPSGSTTGGSDIRSQLVSGAAAFKGVNYVYGGESPKGFDCSGLVQYVYGKMGVNMPRVSQQQATQGKVTPLNKLQQGDFVAWGNSPATAHHIAIYAGNGMVWEAPHTGAQVRLRKISPSEAGIMGIHLNI
jgi:cell wall-associated NlpC family hydrolase